MTICDRYQNVMVGADPEFFLYDKIRDRFISAVGKIGGTKANPRPIDRKGSFVQEDNVLGEMNIIPAKSPSEFVKNVSLVRKYIKSYVHPLEVRFIPSAIFHHTELESPAALMNGCDEDFSAWEKVENEIPSLLGNPYRTAGGHIHVSYDNPTISSMIDLVKTLDVFVGVPLSEFEHNVMRQETYGRTGNFRPKDYGIEYRTPSNIWSGNDNQTYQICKQVIKAIDWLNEGKRVAEEDYEDIKNAIENLSVPSRYNIFSAYFLDNKYEDSIGELFQE